MTDGIIQQVFNKYLNMNNSYTTSHAFIMLERAEQELIEKIKQEVDKMQMSIIYRDGLKRVLIGDNQE